MSGLLEPGDVVGGRWVVTRGPVAIQGLDGCTDPRCTRLIDRETREDVGCMGYHLPGLSRAHRHDGPQVSGARRGMSALSFFVAGKPQTAGSKTAVPMGARMGVIEAGSKESRARKRTWRGDLRDAANRALTADTGFLSEWESPLHLTITIVRKRPSAHMGSGRNAGVVKDWALARLPVERPDTVKIVRAAEDALTGVVWADDSQIVQHSLHKAFADQVGFSPLVEGLFVSVRVATGYMGPQLNLAVAA